MIPEYKHKTNIGVGLGFMLSMGIGGMARDPETKDVAGVMALISLALFVWGSVQYARGKGHSPWWGALGVFSIIGFFVLIFLPDRCKDGQPPSRRAIRAKDEAFLFPSDARVVNTSAATSAAPRPGAPSGRREYHVRFGSAVAVDQFGFVREGSVALDGEQVVLRGPRHWSVLARFGAFLVLAPLLHFLLGPLFAILLTLALLHYFAASQAQLVLSRRALRAVQRSGRKVCFYAEDPQSGARKRSLFRLESEPDAAEFEQALGATQVARAA